ncbi:hypothetical protein LTR49_027317 [Elasticomyces elasticus]|nr:hypothetical protein LTR49_027317 [Elasticomyces elasticus]
MDVDCSYGQYKNTPIYRCLIGIHSLGPLTEGGKSESQVALYPFIGSGYSARIDIVLRDV